MLFPTDYVLLSAPTGELLAEKVKGYLAASWTPLGAPFASDHLLYQAVILFSPDEGDDDVNNEGA